jgi:hypothetical protein
MALTNEEKAYLAALEEREGKLVVCSEVEAVAQQKRMDAILDMAGLIDVTVSDWETLIDVQVPADMIYPVLAELPAAIEAEDGPKVGALLCALYKANLAHFGL